jgi:dTDP-4-dehydrorhamnose 3,5-epimerase/CDP-3, 6-dideoxy-D-glycero-D-glycero-4-hexulose-5-epimerase
MDVVLDIRKNSPTYGIFFAIELSAEKRNALIIPKGMAHGFKSLEENTNVTYLQTSCYVQNHDFGIDYDSFGVDWNTANPIISDRDASFPFFGSFNTPFVFGQN